MYFMFFLSPQIMVLSNVKLMTAGWGRYWKAYTQNKQLLIYINGEFVILRFIKLLNY